MSKAFILASRPTGGPHRSALLSGNYQNVNIFVIYFRGWWASLNSVVVVDSAAGGPISWDRNCRSFGFSFSDDTTFGLWGVSGAKTFGGVHVSLVSGESLVQRIRCFKYVFIIYFELAAEG